MSDNRVNLPVCTSDEIASSAITESELVAGSIEISTPELIAFRREYMSHAITKGPLMDHPDFVQYARADRIEELEAALDKALDALDEAIYLLAPDEKDMERKAGVYRIVATYKDLKGQDDGS